jgi:Flp pilus assembly protein TadD
MRGGIYGALGDYEKAMADFDRAVELEPTHSKNFSERGVAWLNLGDHAAAIRDLDTAVRLDPHDGNAYYNLACVHALEGHTTSALLLLKTALVNGYQELDHAAQDADFISLRDDPRFWEILDREQPE